MRVLELNIYLKRDCAEHTKSIVRRYWNRGDDGLFKENVASLGEEIGESPVGLLEFVRKHSFTTLKNIMCPVCSEEIYVDCRSSYLKYVCHRQRSCSSCRSGRVGSDECDDDYEGSGDSSGCVVGLGENEQTAQCTADMERVMIAAPVRVFSGFMIDLANFSASPAEAFAACQGATLVVVKDGVPLFYCVGPDVMARNLEKDESTS